MRAKQVATEQKGLELAHYTKIQGVEDAKRVVEHEFDMKIRAADAKIARARRSMRTAEGVNSDSAEPSASELGRFVGTWKAAGVEGREEFLKAMSLPWILRKIAAALPQPDNVFFIDDEGVLHSHSSSMGRVIQAGRPVQKAGSARRTPVCGLGWTA